jgi:hypothetical protein
MTLGIKRSVLQHWCINQVKTLLSLAIFHFNLRGEEAQGEGTRSRCTCTAALEGG